MTDVSGLEVDIISTSFRVSCQAEIGLDDLAPLSPSKWNAISWNFVFSRRESRVSVSSTSKIAEPVSCCPNEDEADGPELGTGLDSSDILGCLGEVDGDGHPSGQESLELCWRDADGAFGSTLRGTFR